MAMMAEAMTGSIWAFDYSSYGSISLQHTLWLPFSEIERSPTSREFHMYTEVPGSGQKTAVIGTSTAEFTAG